MQWLDRLQDQHHLVSTSWYDRDVQLLGSFFYLVDSDRHKAKTTAATTTDLVGDLGGTQQQAELLLAQVASGVQLAAEAKVRDRRADPVLEQATRCVKMLVRL
jgi:hypothetical protein